MSSELTEREAARIGPRELKEPGSKSWVYQTLNGLRYKWQRLDLTLEEWNETIDELRQHKAWEALGHATLDDLLQVEIGRTLKESVETLATRTHALNIHGMNQHTGGLRITKSTSGTDTAEYRVARIARDRPDILERMKQGEYTSVRQAALEAGIVKARISIPSNPDGAARAIARHFGPEEIERIIALLENA